MSTTIEEGLTHRDTLLEVEHDVERREAERRDLAREIAAQHERLHTLRATVLEELTKQRRVTMPRWPSGRFDCCCTSSTVASCSWLMSPSSVISSPSWRCGMRSLSEEALMPNSRPAAGKSRGLYRR